MYRTRVCRLITVAATALGLLFLPVTAPASAAPPSVTKVIENQTRIAKELLPTAEKLNAKNAALIKEEKGPWTTVIKRLDGIKDRYQKIEEELASQHLDAKKVEKPFKAYEDAMVALFNELIGRSVYTEDAPIVCAPMHGTLSDFKRVVVDHLSELLEKADGAAETSITDSADQLDSTLSVVISKYAC